MPSEWAASGAKLVLPNLELKFQQTPVLQQQERLLGQPQLSLQPLNEPSFVGKEGLTCVEVESGAYSITNARVGGGEYDSKAHFRFHLDFPKGATRNDVELPAERVFFTGTCWTMRKDELETTHTARTASQQELKDVSELYDKLQVDDGVLQQTLRMRSKIMLLERIEELERLHAEQEQHLPNNSDCVVCDSGGIVFEKQGYMTVKRKGGMLGLQEQYHIVGTFEWNEFFFDGSAKENEDTASSSSS